MKNLIILTAIALATIAQTQAGVLSAPLQSTLDKYVVIQTALAGDSMKGVAAAAADMAATAKASNGAVPDSVAAQAEALSKAADITAARDAFKPLSARLIATLSAQTPISGGYVEAFCPMANASWIQSGQKIANPYFGSSMSTCGKVRKSFSGEPRASVPARSGTGCCGG